MSSRAEDRMYAEERQQAMAEEVRRHGRLSVTALATEFDVTSETVRRDLSALERLRLVRRVHGGAVPASSLTYIESGLGERQGAHTDEKDRIAHAGLALLPDSGTCVLLDAGTTTAALAARIPVEQELTVITHAIPVASRLADHRNIALHVLPGRVRPVTHAAVGPETVTALGLLRAEVAFLGTNGLTARHGASTPDRAEAETKRAMAAAAEQVVVLADSSKVGVESTVRFAEAGMIDVLVTDDGVRPADRAELEQHGIEVVVA